VGIQGVIGGQWRPFSGGSWSFSVRSRGWWTECEQWRAAGPRKCSPYRSILLWLNSAWNLGPGLRTSANSLSDRWETAPKSNVPPNSAAPELARAATVPDSDGANHRSRGDGTGPDPRDGPVAAGPERALGFDRFHESEEPRYRRQEPVPELACHGVGSKRPAGTFHECFLS
jgi:hypothetical protein